MDEENIHSTLLRSFVSMISEFYKSSTIQKVPHMLPTSNLFSLFSSSKDKIPGTPSPVSQLITDDQLQACIKRASEHVKITLKNLQGDQDGIPVTGVPVHVQAFKTENIEFNIISMNYKLHRVSDFNIANINCNLKDGSISVKTIWPQPYLSESYELNGLIGGKKVSGSGVFKIAVTNFSLGFQLRFVDKSDRLEVIDLKFTTDFDDAKVAVTGLKIEGSDNAEKIMNDIIQRDKSKVKELLLANTMVLSEYTQAALNAKLKDTNKLLIVETVKSWCKL